MSNTLYAEDRSLARNWGVVVGAPTYSATGASVLGAAWGKSLALDGSTQWVSLGTGMQITAAWTAELAFKRGRTSHSDAEALLAKWGSNQPYILYIGTDNKVYFGWYNASDVFAQINTTTAVTDTSTAHRAAASWDGDKFRLFLDGTLEATTASTTKHADAVNPAYVGRSDTSAQAFLGSIDEVRFSSVCRYTASYTPAAAPFDPDANTFCLLQFDHDGALVDGGGNPLIDQGAALSWEETDVANSDVKEDAANSRYLMNYSGYSATENKWRTGFATCPFSSDPTVAANWTKLASNPVFTPDADDGYIAANGSHEYDPTSNKWLLVYHSFDGRLKYATFTDPATLTRQGLFKGLGTSGQPDDGGLVDPFLKRLSDGSFLLLYSGIGGAGRTVCAMTCPSGVDATVPANWTRRGTVATGHPAEPSFYEQDDGQIVLFAEDVDANRVIYQSYVDLATLTQAGGWITPVLDKASGWQSAQVFDSCPLRRSGTIYLFHAGATIAGSTENLDASIGVATRADSEPASAAGAGGLLLRRRRAMAAA